MKLYALSVLAPIQERLARTKQNEWSLKERLLVGSEFNRVEDRLHNEYWKVAFHRFKILDSQIFILPFECRKN